MTQPVAIQLVGGMGNQLFQWSATTAAAKTLVPEATVVADRSVISSAGDVIALLASAQAVIGANSSLNWWGAFINPCLGNYKVFPQKWFTSRAGATNLDLIPPEWIVM